MEGSSEEEQLAVGCVLAITTSLGDRFEGRVITFDRPSNIVVFQEGPASKGGARRNIRLLKANYIREFELLRRDEDPLDLSKCFLDLAGLQAREESAIRFVLSRIGKSAPILRAISSRMTGKCAIRARRSRSPREWECRVIGRIRW